MYHQKVKTEPCMSPESPFMRKPSKEFLQRLAFNKGKLKEQDKNMQKSSEYFTDQNISKISFIPYGTTASIESLRNQPTKLKKNTIDLEKFKINHENQKLKNQQQEIRRKNIQLTEQNKALRKQLEQLRKQLESSSRISKFSSETLQQTETSNINKRNTFLSLGSQQSLLQIESYKILPTGSIEISKVNSLQSDEEFNLVEECNFLSTSLGKKGKNNLSNQEKIRPKETLSYRQYIEILNNRIYYLEKELQNSQLRQKELQSANKRLVLSFSMSQRKLDIKQSQLKQIKVYQKKKKYQQKLYELSSEEEYEQS